MEESIKKRWQETSRAFEDSCVLEAQEMKRQKEAEKKRVLMKQNKAIEKEERLAVVANNEVQFQRTCEKQLEGPLILNEVVAPIEEQTFGHSLPLVTRVDYNHQVLEARKERDEALALARHCRDVAERCRTETRRVRDHLESKIEVVRDFWRNKVVEGESRSGRILRASLIRKINSS